MCELAVFFIFFYVLRSGCNVYSRASLWPVRLTLVRTIANTPTANRQQIKIKKKKKIFFLERISGYATLFSFLFFRLEYKQNIIFSHASKSLPGWQCYSRASLWPVRLTSVRNIVALRQDNKKYNHTVPGRSETQMLNTYNVPGYTWVCPDTDR